MSDDLLNTSPRFRWILGFLLATTVVILWLPAPDGMSVEAHRLIAVTVFMAGLWATQIVPLAATSLIPLAAFPFLGIMKADAVSKAFVNDTLFLYFGGMIIALGIERWQLHRRIALNLVAIVGVSPRRLVLGFLLSTAVMSMWISNTACTLMMLPIAMAMLSTLDEIAVETSQESTSGQLAVSLLLSIAYGASLGGMMTQVGTPTNSTAMGIFRMTFAEGPDVSMSQWLFACAPIGIVYLAVTWMVLVYRLPRRNSADRKLREHLQGRLVAMGRPDCAEIRMMIVFAATGILWVFRSPLTLTEHIEIPGWSSMYISLFDRISPWFGSDAKAIDSTNVITDSTLAMAMAILMFFLPSGYKDGNGGSLPLMNWKTASKLPWDMILLFGGGFAIAEGFKETGLSHWMGVALQGPLNGKPEWLVIAVLCLAMTFLTEFTSNVATVSTVMPTLLAMSEPLNIDARLLLIPVTLAASCAFMLPIGTPPNAIVFSTGRISPRQMALYGLVLNLVGVPILTVGTMWVIKPVLGIP